MSLDIVKKNISSPFHNEREKFYLQRSIVDSRGEGGAYESGGFNPDMVYNNDAANEAIESLGKVIGAGLYAKDEDKNKIKEKKLDPVAIRGEASRAFKVKNKI